MNKMHLTWQLSCAKLVAAVLVAVIFAANTRAQQNPPGAKSDDKAHQAATPKKSLDLVNDSIPNSFDAVQVLSSPISQPSTAAIKAEVDSITKKQRIAWGPSTGALRLLVSSNSPAQSSCQLVDKDQAYVFHLTNWSQASDASFNMTGSSWYAYALVRGNALSYSREEDSGSQAVYGKKRVLIIGIATFDSLTKGASLDKFRETMTATVTQGAPENVTDLGLLISAVGGFTGAKAEGTDSAGVITPIYLTIGCQPGTPKLPYTLSVTDSVVTKDGESPKQASSAGTIACTNGKTGAPCTAAHTFEVKDKEYWDVSIGVTTPGPRETKYSFSSGAAQTSVTRHTDFYGMFDIFPAGYWLPKDGWFPHIAVGLPLTSQTFYRPFFGLSENLTGWTGAKSKLSLPVDVNFFAGVVYMKVGMLTGNPTTQPEFNEDLGHKRVWKGTFGIELPISSMASKLGKKATGSGGAAKSTGTGS